MGMDDADHFQTQGIEARHDQVRIATRVDDDGFFVSGSPMIVQLHWSGPTGKVSRMSAGAVTVMRQSCSIFDGGGNR